MKRINDSHGHLTGNRALCRLADIFRFSCRSIDTAARYGGDEFAIILPETGAKEADAVGRRICERLSSDREEPTLSVSVGIAVYPEDGTTIGNPIPGSGSRALQDEANEMDAMTYPENCRAALAFPVC